MRTIGLIGGMSWESTETYYRILNEEVRTKLGGLHSVKCLLYSFDFAEIEALQKQARWKESGWLMIGIAQGLERAGAECIVICTNTMHKLAEDVQKQINIPILHIADATAKKVKEHGLNKVGLLGTRFTMEEDFYQGRLARTYGLEVVIPKLEERDIIHNVIYDELCLGEIRPDSKAKFMAIMQSLVKNGAEGIILGCTEIGLLVKQEDSQVPLFDTTRIHAEAAVEWALEKP
jgi:aspartate racemase